MHPDLEELMRETAVPPSAPLDTGALLDRARGVQRRRRAVAAGAVTALLVLAVVVPLRLSPGQQVEFTGPAGDGSRDPGAEQGAAADEGALVAMPDGVVYGPDGLHRSRDGDRQTLWHEPVVAAFEAGGWVVFQPDASTDGPAAGILAIPDGADVAEPVVEPEPPVRLHGAYLADGLPQVAYTRRVGGGDDEEEWLHLRSLADGTDRRVLQTGRIESGLGALAHRDGTFAAALCHMQCELVLFDASGAELDRFVPPVGEGDVRAATFVGDRLALVVFRASQRGWEQQPAVTVYDPVSWTPKAAVDLPVPVADWWATALGLLHDGALVVSLQGSGVDVGWEHPVVVNVSSDPARVVGRMAVELAVRPFPAD